MQSILRQIPGTCLIVPFLVTALFGFSEETELHAHDSTSYSDTSKIRIEYLAHASFILTYKDHSLLLDPFADSVWISYTFPKDIKVDAIFSTHPHYDHDGGIFRNLKPYWEGKFPFYQDSGNYAVGEFKISGTRGKHCDPYGKEFDQKNTIFVFEAGDLKLAHWGDNGPITDQIVSALKGVNILLLPIDDTYHILKAEEINEVIEKIQPDIVVPMHYRIPALEPTPGNPKNLGPIDAYLQQKSNVTWLEDNILEINHGALPKEMQYYVFKHSPLIPPP
jgi:L-ascorbate metabolism protein UlaG (beta-lactamase superfamily)